MILACGIGCMKKVTFSELCEIARVAYLDQITNIRSGRAQKLLKESREGWDICVRDWACEKIVVSETPEIARLAYFGQITNIGSGRARNLYKECSQEG